MPKQNTNRVSVRDIDDAIFRPNSPVKGENIDQNFMEEPEREVICFTIYGKQDRMTSTGYPLLEDEENPDVLAKIVTINDNYPRYMVKRDSNGRLFNPLGIEEGNHNKFIHKAGKEQFEFKSVPKIAFDYYVHFLSTKNLAHLRTAEREIF
jgi:hypothetical protein